MNRESFLRELADQLNGLRESERSEILADYDEHFRAGMAAGKSEEEVIRSLGSPRSIGKSFRIEALLEESERPTAATILRALFASVSLGFFNIVVMLGPFAAIVAIVISLWAAAVSVGLSGIAAIFGVIAQPILPEYVSLAGFHPAFLVSAGIGFAALGILALIGMWQLSRWVVTMIGRYVRLNVRIVTNRR